MTLSAYWWRPTQDLKTVGKQIIKNPSVWARQLMLSGRLRNFGDELSRLALREATGHETRWVPVPKAEVVGIGSVIEAYIARNGTGLIWGSGLKHPGGREDLVNLDNTALAVRGTFTRDALKLRKDLPLGDPGLLARSIFRAAPSRQGVAVLPHYKVFGTKLGRSAVEGLRAEGARVIVPTAPVQDVCGQIGSADYLLTSSLHGLVVADALGVPASLVSFIPTTEPEFKYFDYVSIFGATPAFRSAVSLLDPVARNAAQELAVERTERISDAVDSAVEGLLRASRVLR
ncbi:polysaccharide pyruvyl transferase family protein [Microbacterium sp.]|uniref:polysaccharide pyruvyl transferase family protein n=1 Tax=Microbacterium sp. TaxID=51671 RepID=UPI003C1698CE